MKQWEDVEVKNAKCLLVWALVLALTMSAVPPSPTAAYAAVESEKSSVHWTEATRVWFSVGHDWLNKPIWENSDQIDSLEWVGPTSPDSTLWFEFAAEDEDGNVKYGRPTYVEVTYKMIVGGDQPQLGDDVVFEYDITYEPDGTPVYRDHHTGLPLNGAVLKIAAWWAIRESWQRHKCRWFIAASIALGVPGAVCWNPIWFKSLEEAIDQSFDEQLQNYLTLSDELELTQSAKGKKPNHWALPVPINSRYNATVTVQAKFKAAHHQFTMIRQIEPNYDGDGDFNITELSNGTSMLDPEDSSASTLLPNVVGLNVLSVPDVFGHRFRVGDVQYHPDSTPAGTILSQSPAGGTRHPVGTAINLVVSNGPSGPTNATIPCVEWLSEQDARNAILLAGLTVGTVTYQNNWSDCGIVFDQGPDCELLVPFGTAVNLFVSLGPAVEQCEVPDIVGMMDSAARAAIQSAGFDSESGRTVDYTSTGAAWDSALPWSVVSQETVPGQADCGGVVYYHVKGAVTPPCVVGLAEQTAINLIESVQPAGALDAVVTSRVYSSTTPSGYVVAQSDDCHTDVIVGTVICLTISKGLQPPQKVTVPNVVGKTISEASSLLAAVTLNLGTVGTAYSDTVPAGKIISQSPVSGTQVDQGSSVNVVKSLGSQPPTTTVVPNVVGKQEAAATTDLTNAQLVKGSVGQEFSNQPVGEVLFQSPAAGTTVAIGSSVSLLVSKGPQPPNPLTAWIESPSDGAILKVGVGSTVVGKASGGTPPYRFHWIVPDTNSEEGRLPRDVVVPADTDSWTYTPVLPSQGAFIYLRVTDFDGHTFGPIDSATTVPVTVNP